MKLIDILDKLEDYVTVGVYDGELTLIARYDGKNSIDEDLNDRDVINIFPIGNANLNIVID